MLALRSLSLHYTGETEQVHVLRGLELEIGAGERVAVVGPSGSGKTSLLLLLAGLERPSAGEVLLDGIALGDLDSDALADLRRSRIGIVFQSFHLVPSLTAVDNVALPLDIAGVAGAGERADALLARVGLASRARHYPSQLSGGEQQRVAIARALIHEPALILADEPTGNLDADSGAGVADLLFELAERVGSTVVLVTHDRELAGRCARVLEMHAGRLFEGERVERARATNRARSRPAGQIP